MSVNNNLELISFKVCPFVQRSVIALQEKNIAFKLTHITPGDEPDWFKKVSPMGKVPVLLVDDQPIFESAVIAEYLDEVYEPTLHPADPLTKALQRSWIEFCSDLLGTQYRMMTAQDKDGFERHLAKLQQGLARVGENLAEQTPFFAGADFALIDSTYAPLFMRIALMERVYKVDFVLSERLQAWRDALLAKDSVNTSVVEDFDEVFIKSLKDEGSYMVSQR